MQEGSEGKGLRKEGAKERGDGRKGVTGKE
jgi:hypothetical protein